MRGASFGLNYASASREDSLSRGKRGCSSEPLSIPIQFFWIPASRERSFFTDEPLAAKIKKCLIESPHAVVLVLRQGWIALEQRENVAAE